jgi:hypothetical protein
MLLLRNDLQEKRRCAQDEADWQNAGGKARLSRPTGFGGGPRSSTHPSGHGLGVECPALALQVVGQICSRNHGNEEDVAIILTVGSQNYLINTAMFPTTTSPD